MLLMVYRNLRIMHFTTSSVAHSIFWIMKVTLTIIYFPETTEASDLDLRLSDYFSIHNAKITVYINYQGKSIHLDHSIIKY
jgi:hypothetical protein